MSESYGVEWGGERGEEGGWGRGGIDCGSGMRVCGSMSVCAYVCAVYAVRRCVVYTMYAVCVAKSTSQHNSTH